MITDTLRIVVTVPGLRVQSEMNTRQHWSVRRRRFAEHKAFVAIALAGVGTVDRDRLRWAPRIKVKFTRIGGRKLDPDNLVSGFKAVLDQVCSWLQIDDGSDRLELVWPTQESGGGYGIRIELEATQ